LRHRCSTVRLAPPAAPGVPRQAPGSAPRGRAEWLCRVAQPPTQAPDGRGAGGTRPQTAIGCARAWPLGHAPHPASVSPRGTPGPPSPHGAPTRPGRPALPNAAPMESPNGRRAGADRGAAPAQPGVDRGRTR